MKYLVMECHPAYVVLLEEEGRFIKAANMGYHVGQFVIDIICQQDDPGYKVKKGKNKLWLAAIPFAACIGLVVVISQWMLFTVYGTARIQINPDIMLNINRLNYVIRAEGMNSDGEMLLEEDKISFVPLDKATAEIVHRATEQGYLKEGGAIRFSVNAKNSEWETNVADTIQETLENNSPESIIISCADEHDPVAENVISFIEENTRIENTTAGITEEESTDKIEFSEKSEKSNIETPEINVNKPDKEENNLSIQSEKITDRKDVIIPDTEDIDSDDRNEDTDDDTDDDSDNDSSDDSDDNSDDDSDGDSDDDTNNEE